MRRLLLVHDVLDLQLVDRHEDKIGRVDALILAAEPGKPLRVQSILVGGPARQERLGRPAVWLAAVLRRLTHTRSDGVSEIPFARVRRIADVVAVDVAAETLESQHVERWLAEHIVRHVPGGAGERK